MADYQVRKVVKQPSGLYQETFVNAVHQSDSTAVTAVQITSNLLTITAANAFTPGQQVSFTGLTNASFLNGVTVTVVAATGTGFTANFSHLNYGPTAETTGFASSSAGSVVILGPGGRLDPSIGGGSSGASSFDQLAGGTNTTAAMVVGSGASLSFTGTGVVNANEIIGLSVVGGGPTHEGQLLISQPGNTSVAFADPLVQGLYPEGASVSSPPAFAAPTTIQPVFVGGKGVDGNLHGVKVANDGTVAIAGNKGANAVAPSTDNVPVLAAMAGTSNPAWTNGNLVPLSVDTAGNLRVNATGGGGTQYAEGATVVTPTGTVAFGKDATNVVKALKLDGSGNLDVNIQSAVSAAGDGASLPSVATWIGASDGTNLRGLTVESAANKNLRVAIFQGSTEAIVTGGGALKVDGSAVTQPVSIAGTVAQNITQVGGAAVTLGQKTSANSFPVVFASDQSRINTQDAAEANANGSTAVPTNALFIGAKGADGFLHALSSSTNDGKLDVNASFSGTVSTDFVVDRVQSGAITSTQTVVVNTKGAASVVFNITGTWTGTIVFEALMPDTSTWVPASCYAKFPSGVATTQTTANGQWVLPVGAINQFRVRGNTVSSGTATANLEAGAGGLVFEVVQATAANLNATVTGTVAISSGTVTANQGTANTVANGWPTKITDGTNVLGTSANPLVSQDKADGAPGAASQPTQALQVAGWDGTHLRALSTDASGFLNVNSTVSGTFTPALTSDRTVTGTITNTQNVLLSTQGTGTALFNITGTWTGTIVFEATVDGTNWLAAKAIPKFPTGDSASQTTANGQWSIPTGGLNSIRVRGNTVASGTATIWIEGGAGSQDVQVTSFDANNFLVTAQGLSSTTSNALPGVNPVAVSTSSVAIISANAARKEIIVINTGTSVIYLGLGQNPTVTAYHVALGPCTANNDGTGGTFTSDLWKGAISAIGSASGSVCVTELT